MAKRPVIIQTDEREQVIAIKCGRCGYTLRRADERHARAFCALVSVGIDPREFVRREAKYLPPALPPFTSRQPEPDGVNVAIPRKRLEAVEGTG